MSIYYSDKESNRKIVVTSLKNSDGSYKDDELVQSSCAIADQALALSATVVTRRDLLPYVLENKNELAIWKAVFFSLYWVNFLTQIQLNRTTVRDVNMIKQIIDQEFKQRLDDAIADGFTDTSDKIQIIKGIRSVTTSYGPGGLMATIELL